MKKPSLPAASLYVIVDSQVIGRRQALQVAASAIRGGARVIQWRDKQSPDGAYLEVARRLRQLIRPPKAFLVVNDRVDVALRIKADGVHVGHEDLPVRDVRQLVGRSMWVGRSTHSIQEAIQAERDGADYIGVGPVFSTPTKPHYKPVGLTLVRQAAQAIRIPWVAIGGIDLKNLPLVLSAGATRVAVVRAVAAAKSPEAAARAFQEQLT